MTLWTSPVPMHMAGKEVTAPRMGTTTQQERDASTTVSAALAAQGASAGAGSSSSSRNLNSNSSSSSSSRSSSNAPPQRRQTLGSVPSAGEVHQSQEKWLEFAPTSPQRRASFVSEPGAVDGNPFEIYKEPARTDNLGTQSFYEAGASYSVKQHAPAPPSASPPPPPLLPAATTHQSNNAFASSSSSLGLSTSTSRPGSRSGNPFYEAPLSPIRYNKPIAKVELSPQSSAMSTVAFMDLDPLKRVESPTASIPLDQLKITTYNEQQAAIAAAVAAQQQEQEMLQQQQLQLQQQQQQQWGAWPQQQQQGGQAFGFSPPQQQPTEWAAFGSTPPQQQQQQQQQQGFGDPFGWPPAAGPGATAVAAAAVAKTPNTDDFNLLLVGGGGGGGGKEGGREEGGGGGAIFDPVRQKSLAESSFDLGVGAFFPEETAAQGGGGGGGGARRSSSRLGGYGEDEDEEEEGPVDHHDEEEDEGSISGDGVGGLEMQDDHFHHEGEGGREGGGEGGVGATGMYYEVAFTAPTTFGMLLERKDEWTRGAVARRERTVVTLVVEGGEAEAKGVGLGSMIASINGEDVTGLTYKETLERIKSQVRPMRVVFERESLKEEVLQGYFFVSKGPFFSNPTTMDKWKRKYIVLGGPIAKKNVLQIYDSKRAYHNTVVALFQRKRPAHRVKTYALTYAFKLSPLQERKMEGHTAPLKFFSFMTPAARFKSIRVASETRKTVAALHERFGRFAGKGAR